MMTLLPQMFNYIGNFDIAYYSQNDRAIQHMVITVLISAFCWYFIEKNQDSKKARNDYNGYTTKEWFTNRILGSVLTVSIVYLVIFPMLSDMNERKMVKSNVESYIETLDVKTGNQSIIIEHISEKGDSVTTRVLFSENDVPTIIEMPVKIMNDSGIKPYITYSTLDKSYTDIMPDENIIANFKEYDKGTNHNHTLNISNESYLK